MISDLASWVGRARKRGDENLTFSVKEPVHPGGGYVFSFDGKRILSQFIVWPDGATEAVILHIVTEEHLCFDISVATNNNDLDRLFDAFSQKTWDCEHSEG